MKYIRQTVKLSLVILSLALFSICFARADEKSGVCEKNPWLEDAAPFIQVTDLEKSRPGLTALGAFGVGNGHVFALTGLELPQNKLTNLVGPVYEKGEEQQFYPVWTELWRGAATPAIVDLPKGRLYRVKRTSIIVSEEKSADLEMKTITYAPPGANSILRIFSIRNISEKRISDLALVTKSGGRGEKAVVSGTGNLTQKSGDKRMTIGYFAKGAQASEGEARLGIGALDPGAGAEAILYITFNYDKEKFAPPSPESPENGYPLLKATRADWEKWFDGALTVESSDPKLAGLFENTLALMKVQQSAGSYAISPMAKYSGFWCRDNFGPIRFLLASGKFEDARRSLEYFDYATRVSGFRNRYPLDIPIDPVPKEPDWETLEPQLGDDPDLLILQYYWYYKATGDADFIRAHYGFLRRNLTGQKHTDFRLPFNGDETYQVYVMMTESAPMKSFYTAATGFYYSAAARALSVMAFSIGEKKDAQAFLALAKKCRDKTEEYYWDEKAGYYIPYIKKDTLEPAKSPFADVNLTPLWIGVYEPPDKKQRSNVMKTVDKLFNKRGTMKSSARCQLYTGMVPGMLLYNLRVLEDYAMADTVYTAMMTRVISNTGEFAEGYDSRDKWIFYGSAPTVYRPWESGINAEAILSYITGLKHVINASGAVTNMTQRLYDVTIQPHLPPGVDWIKFDNIYAGPYRLSIEVKARKDAAPGPGGVADNTPIVIVKNLSDWKINTRIARELINNAGWEKYLGPGEQFTNE